MKSHLIRILIAALVLAAIVGAMLLWQKQSGRVTLKGSPEPMVVEVSNTPHQNGVIGAPAGFPASIPVTTPFTESQTTKFPEQNATQQAVAFESKLEGKAEYERYLTFLRANGYNNITAKFSGPKGDGNSSMTGEKESERLSVFITERETVTVRIVRLVYPKNNP